MKISHKKRKIGYTYGSLSGLYPFRGEKSIAYESSLERDMLKLLEHDKRVLSVIEQPFTIEYVNDNGRNTTYTPDFLVNFRIPRYRVDFEENYTRPWLVEVKPHDVLFKDLKKLKKKFKAGIRYATQEGYKFKIFTEKRIRCQTLFNIDFLNRFKHAEYDPIEEERILDFLEMVGHTYIDVIIANLFVTDVQKGLGLGQIYHMLSVGKLGCDFTRPIGNRGVVWINTEYWEGECNGW